MSLKLYPETERSFNSNGLGILAEAKDDLVEQELNGKYELSFQYPVQGLRYADLVLGCYVTAAPDPATNPQPFRIYRITKPMRGLVTVYARHQAYRLRDVVVKPFVWLGDAQGALDVIKGNSINDCPFTFWSDIEKEKAMVPLFPVSAWSLLGGSEGSILDLYGGEYEFLNDTIKLQKRRGSDRGVTIRYGKNLKSLKQDESIANMYTGIVPYWSNGEFAEVMLPEGYVSGPGEYTEICLKPVDFTNDFEEKPTEEQLRERAEEYVVTNDIGKPEVSLDVEFVQLEQTEEYRGMQILEQVLLGDTVRVIFPEMNVDVSTRAVKTRYIPSLGRYESISLGSSRANFAQTVAQINKKMR